MESKGNCQKCRVCGLVIDNHDFDMAKECGQFLIPSYNDSLIEALHDWASSNE